jgi:hypothetical protein
VHVTSSQGPISKSVGIVRDMASHCIQVQFRMQDGHCTPADQRLQGTICA